MFMMNTMTGRTLSRGMRTPLGRLSVRAFATEPLQKRTFVEVKAPYHADAIFFGSIGSLVHMCKLQYNAWTQALKENGLPEWEKDLYVKSLAESLKFNGGRNRLNSWANQIGLDLTPEKADDVCTRKHKLFHQMMKEGLTVRPGVIKLLKEAKAKGLKTAFVTTTPRSNVDYMMDSMKGLDRNLFDLVTCGESSFQGGWGRYGEGKPSADPYLYVMKRLNVKRPIAFEDTFASLQSPVNAGIPCVGLPNEWSTKQDFSQAQAKMAELGEDITLAKVQESIVPKQKQAI